LAIIVIDPGHGGSDPGAVGYGLREKDLTLDIAAKTCDALRSYVADVYMTRDTDVDMEPAQRAALANRLGAAYCLSIHINAGGGTGFESFVHVNAGDRSLALGDIIHRRVSSFYNSSGFMDRGRKNANFAILRLTQMPALLLENLFVDTARDAIKLAVPAFRQQIANAIAAGLVQALGLKLVSPADQMGGISKMKIDGLIVSDHDSTENITWGTFAAVINRSIGRSSLGDQWNPAGEVAKLKSAGLIFSDHDEKGEVSWGEFATVLNRLRGRSPWDPVAEIQKLKSDGLLDSVHEPVEVVNWASFAGVFNAIRAN